MSRRASKRSRPVETSLEEEQTASTSGEESPAKGGHAHGWECTVCTYRNRLGAFKCSICDSRKGTSTRKPRMGTALANTSAESLAVQQQAAALDAVNVNKNKMEKRFSHLSRLSSGSPPLTPTTHRRSRKPENASREGDAESDTTPSEAPSSSRPHGTPPKASKTPRARRARGPSSSTVPAVTESPRPRRTRKKDALLNRIVDANSARTMTVTCGGVTVAITDYKPL